MASSAASFQTLVESVSSQLTEIVKFNETTSEDAVADMRTIANEALAMIDDWEKGEE